MLPWLQSLNISERLLPRPGASKPLSPKMLSWALSAQTQLENELELLRLHDLPTYATRGIGKRAREDQIFQGEMGGQGASGKTSQLRPNGG